MVNLKEVTDYLFANGYLHNVKGDFKLTSSFKKAMDALAAGHSVASVKQRKTGALTAATIGRQDVMVLNKVDWIEQYKQFILDAAVPKRCQGKYGEPYDTNKYSEPGMKAFKKAMESGIQYEMLVAATALYYKSAVKMKVAIGRYMEEGRWRSDYDALVASAESNTVKEHINEVTDDGEYSFTKLG